MWADKGYQGAGGTVTVPYRGRWHHLGPGKQAVNLSHAKIRAVGEQANTALKTWRLLRKLRCSPSRTTALVQAVLTLHCRQRTEVGKGSLPCRRDQFRSFVGSGGPGVRVWLKRLMPMVVAFSDWPPATPRRHGH